ncbi:histidine kinase [Angustibacter sp. McL0619]|uniref:sensor histidine kinase n=1 Tax=Angustibacter sp. McL0619 TaxID=3415676 RepID=UPI003CFBB5A1
MVETDAGRSTHGDSARRAVAVMLALTTAVGCLVAALLERLPEVQVWADPQWLTQLFIVGAAGLVVAWARPRNSIGWLLSIAVFLQMASLVGGAYAQVSYADGNPEPGAFFGAWIAAWVWFPSLAMPVAILPAIYPTGRPETRARRRLVAAGIVGITGMCVALAFGPDAPGEAVPGLKLAFPQPPAWTDPIVLGLTALALTVAVVGGLSAASARALRARAPERQQMLWLLFALWPYAVSYFLPVPPWLPGYAFVGVAVAIGILRYRLLDINVVVRRTLFYAPLIALVALVVAVVSTAIARVAPGGALPLVGSAVIVAFLVGPVTGWLRRAVDRFALGERADPVSAVGRVAGRGELVTAVDPVSSVLEAMVEAVGVEYVAVVDTDGRQVVEIGAEPPTTLRLPLREGGDRLGDLVIAVPHDSAGRRIVEALVPHVASVVRNQRLLTEIDAERGRVVAATTAERERIRSDLHDGLGPSLSGISLGLQAADVAISGDQPAVRAILQRTREEADRAVAEVRRVLEALGPAALDHRHLAAAIRDAADRLGFDGDSGPSFACRSAAVAALPPHLEETAYRIAGEALHNVARHARATRCDVSLSEAGGVFELRITDDGLGLRDERPRGVGLESMLRRARAAGGTCAISSQPAAGTVVCVRLPLDSAS